MHAPPSNKLEARLALNSFSAFKTSNLSAARRLTAHHTAAVKQKLFVKKKIQSVTDLKQSKTG
jgi:hypothetical protein